MSVSHSFLAALRHCGPALDVSYSLRHTNQQASIVTPCDLERLLEWLSPTRASIADHLCLAR